MKVFTFYFILLFCLAPLSGQGADQNIKTAIFAGGCFWCMEPPFDKIEGVISTTSGYTGGSKVNPTYTEVSAGETGHAEAIEVKYNSTKITYTKLLEVFWKNIDPFAVNAQFCDHGHQYRAAIFYQNQEQKILAEQSKQSLAKSRPFSEKFKGLQISTEIIAASKFYPAEQYHQDYYRKNPLRYKYYRFSCGRDQRLKEIWGQE